jgi:hypothetical protein
MNYDFFLKKNDSMEINFRHFHQIKISWRVLFFECVSFGMLDVLDGKCWTYTFLECISSVYGFIG